MKKTFKCNISNMHCSNCSGAIEKHFNKKKDINVHVILANNTGIFTYDDISWDNKKIEKELKQIGYPIKKESKVDFDLIKLITCIILTIPFVYMMVLMMSNHNMKEWVCYLEFVLATLVFIIAGFPFLKGMIKDIKNKRLGMDVLVSLGTLTSYIYSTIILFSKSHDTLYFETTSMLLTILLIGKYIEKKAKKKTTSSLKSLMTLQEKQGKVLVDDQVIIKDIHEVKVNDILLVSTGEKIPLDGIIIDNSCEVDESMVTGESLPVLKKINDTLLAGTIIVSGNVKLKVNKEYNQTYLSSIINKVEEIQAYKPKLQRIADKIASFFVPIVVLLSIICFITTYFTSYDLQQSLSRSIAVLMISCPCSLGLATPLSILVGSSKAIKLSIIYNNTDIFEKASKINAICFDKTGTLSCGLLKVINYEEKVSNALDIIYTLESISSHPIAKALVIYAKENNAKLIDLKPVEIIGKGIQADSYFIYKENQFVYLKENDDIIAKVEVVDDIKEDAYKCIETLNKENIEVFMLTGDNKEISLKTANKLNIKNENVYYQIKPEDKLSIIENIQKQNKKVAFVGDGINDSLALNKADLSIAMGSGSDIAISSSDITISNNKLENINKSIKLSKTVYRNIIENFIWAFSYNIVAIPLAFIGVINPIVAGICMAFSNIAVVLNSLRIYKSKVD